MMSQRTYRDRLRAALNDDADDFHAATTNAIAFIGADPSADDDRARYGAPGPTCRIFVPVDAQPSRPMLQRYGTDFIFNDGYDAFMTFVTCLRELRFDHGATSALCFKEERLNAWRKVDIIIFPLATMLPDVQEGDLTRDGDNADTLARYGKTMTLLYGCIFDDGKLYPKVTSEPLGELPYMIINRAEPMKASPDPPRRTVTKLLPPTKIGIPLMPWTYSLPQYILTVGEIFVYTRRAEDKREYTPNKENTMTMEELRRHCVGYFIQKEIIDDEVLIVCIGRGEAGPTLEALRKTQTTLYMVMACGSVAVE